MEDKKIIRLFKLIKLLSEKPHKNVGYLSKVLKCNQSTVYKDLNLLEEIGYLLDKKDNQYFIDSLFEDNVVRLSVDESGLIDDLLESIPEKNPLRESLRKKLRHFASYEILEDFIDKTKAKSLSLIREAIQNKNKIVLKSYQSVNSNSIRDRLVHPIALVKYCSQLVAFEEESGLVKHFKVQRMLGVEILYDTKTLVGEDYQIDLFGFSGNEAKWISVTMNNHAYRFLIEEFPETRTFFRKESENVYVFVTEVRSWLGVGKFLLSTIENIHQIEPKELVEYLEKKITASPIFSKMEKVRS